MTQGRWESCQHKTTREWSCLSGSCSPERRAGGPGEACAQLARSSNLLESHANPSWLRQPKAPAAVLEKGVVGCLSVKKNELLIPRVKTLLLADGWLWVLVPWVLALLGDVSGYQGEPCRKGRTAAAVLLVLLAPFPLEAGVQH